MVSIFQDYCKNQKIPKIHLKNPNNTSITFLKDVNKDISLRSQIFKKPIKNSSYSSNFSSQNQSKNSINMSSSHSKILSIINNKKDKRKDEHLDNNYSKCIKNKEQIISKKKEDIKTIFYRKMDNKNIKKQKFATISQKTNMKKEYIDLKHFLIPKKQIQHSSTIWTNAINYKLMKKLFQLRIKKVNKIPHILKAITIIHETNHSVLPSNNKKVL